MSFTLWFLEKDLNPPSEPLVQKYLAPEPERLNYGPECNLKRPRRHFLSLLSLFP